ncbi:hypothetical protein LINPERHAP2_LOCUS43681, partial [Linum perenne]
HSNCLTQSGHQWKNSSVIWKQTLQKWRRGRRKIKKKKAASQKSFFLGYQKKNRAHLLLQLFCSASSQLLVDASQLGALWVTLLLLSTKSFKNLVSLLKR